jgi:actin-related protein 10
MSTRSSSNYNAFEQRLARLLHDIYYRLLLADPKSSKVIILESPLLPVSIKQTIAKVLFQKLHVPSVSFTSAHLLALLTIGQTTGLVIDCGHLEMTVLPVSECPNAQI